MKETKNNSEELELENKKTTKKAAEKTSEKKETAKTTKKAATKKDTKPDVNEGSKAKAKKSEEKETAEAKPAKKTAAKTDSKAEKKETAAKTTKKATTKNTTAKTEDKKAADTDAKKEKAAKAVSADKASDEPADKKKENAEENVPKYIPADALADGNTLVYLKRIFLKDQVPEKLFSVFNCLRDSVLLLPMNPADKGHFRPDLIKDKSGDYYLPVFSQKQQLPPDYCKLFGFLKMPMEKCVNTAKELQKKNPEIKGLVVDPFTEGMVITYEMMDVIMKMDSKLQPNK